MALILPNYYPGRFNAPTAAYPHGSHKNRSTETSNDGSYYEQAWANDIQGFHSQLLSAAGITPSGVPDHVGASDLYNALKGLFLMRGNNLSDVTSVSQTLANLGLGDANGYVGRLINTRVFTSSGTYTPTPGTKRLLVEMVGGGGAGGGAYAGGSSSSSAGAGGSSGAYGKALLTSVPASISYSVGAGGVSGAGGHGTDGGATNFGTLSVSGGLGGYAFPYAGVATYTDVTSGTSTFSGNFLEAITGGYSSIGLMLSSSYCFSGGGGNSKIGTGGAVVGLNTAGVASAGVSPSPTDYGAGGGGGVSTSATAVAGGNGGNGVILVWEFA